MSEFDNDEYPVFYLPFTFYIKNENGQLINGKKQIKITITEKGEIIKNE